MKRIALLLAVLLAFATMSLAQVSTSDVPTKEDINRFLDKLHMRQQMQTIVNTMMVQMKSNMRQMLQKNMPDATPEDLAKAQEIIEEAFKGDQIPVDEYINVMIPVYQRHFTRGDIDAIVAFYSTPVGQKMMREMPAMMSEGMQAASELAQKQMDKTMARMRERMNETQKRQPKK